MEADQAALAALDDLKKFGGGAVEAVGGGEKSTDFGGAAGGTFSGTGSVTGDQFACSDSSRSEIRWRRSRFRIWSGVKPVFGSKRPTVFAA